MKWRLVVSCIVCYNAWRGLRAALFGYYDPSEYSQVPDVPRTRQPVKFAVSDNTRSVGVPYK